MSGDVRLADLIEANPNFEQQMRDWQSERARKGEDPLDWQAFRELETYIGAPDPGESAPSEFLSFSPPAQASAPEVAASTDVAPEAAASDAASSAEVSPPAAAAAGTEASAADAGSADAGVSQTADTASTGTAEPAAEGKSWAERWGVNA
jgi:hypothetical protein